MALENGRVTLVSVVELKFGYSVPQVMSVSLELKLFAQFAANWEIRAWLALRNFRVHLSWSGVG